MEERANEKDRVESQSMLCAILHSLICFHIKETHFSQGIYTSDLQNRNEMITCVLHQDRRLHGNTWTERQHKRLKSISVFGFKTF